MDALNKFSKESCEDYVEYSIYPVESDNSSINLQNLRDECLAHNSKIVITDIDAETFEIISSYSRCEKPQITQDNFTKVRNTATKYQMHGLVSFCEDLFPKQLSSDDLVIASQPMKKAKLNDGNYAIIAPLPHDLSQGIGGKLLRKSGWDGNSRLFEKNNAVEQSMKYGGKKQMDLLYKHNGVGYAEDRQAKRGSVDELWNAIADILRRSGKPQNVLSIRYQLPAHFNKPKVKKMNFIMYEQLKKGNVNKHPPPSRAKNQKPGWSLCSNERLEIGYNAPRMRLDVPAAQRFVAHNIDPPAPLLPNGWRIMQLPDGKMYYQNDITKQTQWDPPFQS